MIRAVGKDDSDKPIVFFGLAPENLASLMLGQPVKINLKHMNPDNENADSGLPDIDVVLFFETKINVDVMKEALVEKAPKT